VISARVSALRTRPLEGHRPAGIVRAVVDRIGGMVVQVELNGQVVLTVPDHGLTPRAGTSVDVVVDPAALHVIGDADGA
jgi:hypothetical protein